MKVICLFSFILILNFPFRIFAWDWRDLPDQAWKDWSLQIQSVLDELTRDVQSPKDGYYWYLFGSMKSASGFIDNKYVLLAQNQLRKALPTCGKIFSKDPQLVKKCEQKLDSLIKGP